MVDGSWPRHGVAFRVSACLRLNQFQFDNHDIIVARFARRLSSGRANAAPEDEDEKHRRLSTRALRDSQPKTVVWV